MRCQCLGLGAHSALFATLTSLLWYSGPLRLRSCHYLTTLCVRCSHFSVWTAFFSSSRVCYLRTRYSSVLLVLFFLNKVQDVKRFFKIIQETKIVLRVILLSHAIMIEHLKIKLTNGWRWFGSSVLLDFSYDFSSFVSSWLHAGSIWPSSITNLLNKITIFCNEVTSDIPILKWFS